MLIVLREGFEVIDAIFALTTVVDAMSREGEGGAGKWAELDGAVAVQGKVVGWFCIDKGDTRDVEVERVCVI